MAGDLCVRINVAVGRRGVVRTIHRMVSIVRECRGYDQDVPGPGGVWGVYG